MSKVAWEYLFVQLATLKQREEKAARTAGRTELWLKETTPIRQSWEPLIPPRRHVVTNSDRTLLEIIPDGSLRPTSEFSFRRFSGDKYELNHFPRPER